ncbi:hypothetical protein AWE51_04915 [Aquimarina aggregata]|uniref:Uncharacterized protein n=1 Tax=Aquimarina aggregata TaxID=1642818 RepID=A0A163A6G1_9FLAO|nr:hypothetical protein [Aquimarina aggregata]KZS40300.1 hypothetical protein AWE51_04915 [Aquimarina aggregata]
MNKVWKLSESKSDKLILIKNQTIYKGNPGKEKINKFSLDVETYSNNEIEKELFGIPYHYIKKVINQKGIKHIKVLFGNDSEEELIIEDEKIKNEIFEFLKKDIIELKYKLELPSFFNYCKAQIFAILILTGIFIWSMYYAIEIDKGTVFELRGGGGRLGIGGLVFILGNLGKMKLIIGYSAFIGLALLSMFRKLKSRTEIEVLYR